MPLAKMRLCLCSCKSARETNMEKRRGRRPQDARTDGRTESAETENAERNRSDAPEREEVTEAREEGEAIERERRERQVG